MMRFRFTSPSWCLALAIIGRFGLAACSGAEPDPQRTPSKTSPGTNTTEAIGNLDQLSSRRDSLKQLEDQLLKSLEIFSPKSSLDGVLAPEYRPPPASATPGKRSRSEQDRRKSWGLLEPGASSSDSPESDSLNPSGVRGEPGQSLGDESHNRLPRRDLKSKSPLAMDDENSGRRKAISPRDESRADEDSNLPGGIKNQAKRLKDLLGSENGWGMSSPAPGRSSFADFFGFGKTSVTPDQALAHKEYMNQYRQLLEGKPATTTTLATPLGDGSGAVSASPSAFSGGLEALTGSSRSPGSTLAPGNFNSPLSSATMQDRNASALNQWNPLYSTFKVEPPRPAPLSVPMMEVPRRKF